MEPEKGKVKGKRKRSGRPRSDVHRTRCVSVRMSPEELAELDRRCGRVRRGTYLRAVFLGCTPAAIPAINRELYGKLAVLPGLMHIAIKEKKNLGPVIEQALEALREARLALLGVRI